MTTITRRALITNAGKGALALGAFGLLGACATSPSNPSAASSGGPPIHGGTLRAALTGGSVSDSCDPNRLVSNPDWCRATNMYESLVWMDANAQVYNRLAEDMWPNEDATVWTIRLRSGITFHNGKSLAADDLIFSINRIVNPASPGDASTALVGIIPDEIKKLDDLTISVPFDRPYSTLRESLATNVTVYVIPVGFDPKKPIGTGPFKLESFTPGRQTVMTRNENYWNSPFPYLDKIIITDYPDETSQVNALLSNQADVVNLLSQATLRAVTGAGRQVLISEGGGWNPFTMRVDTAPFDDVRVRQAFRLAVDRQAMLDTVFGGYGTIGNDIFGIWSPDYDRSIPQREHDPDQAKWLLKQAGRSDLTTTLVTGDIAQGSRNMAQLFAQQAGDIGVNVKLRNVTVTDFYGPSYKEWVFAQDYWYYKPYLTQVSQATLPSSHYNETHFDNPRYNDLYKQALATLDVGLRGEIAHEMQMIDYTEGGYIIPFFPPVFDGLASNVHGAVESKTGGSFNNWDFAHFWKS
ncbi:peptide/nickel transport system substrate-binding protein [Rhodococcus sp. 27YEA15]|uniref:ABC transporter substrate-binding protein n=1 Tax=Rhodococcus sp. 27YEA15 TaxID=3156259 RepID=UPI003C7AE87B